MPDPDLIVLHRYRYEYEARLAHDRLGEEGIPSMVKGNVFDNQLSQITEVNLLVRPEDASRARALLSGAAGAE